MEGTHWGGFCLNRACVPTKLFAATLDRSKAVQTAAKMGFSKAEAKVDPAAVFKMKDELVGYFSMGTEGLSHFRMVNIGRRTLVNPRRRFTGRLPDNGKWVRRGRQKCHNRDSPNSNS